MADMTSFVCRRVSAPTGGVSITIENDSYAVRFPHDAGVIAQLKTLKPVHRQWDAERKLWLIAPEAIQAVAGFLQERFGQVVIPQIMTEASAQAVKRLVRLEYLGVCKERGDGEPTAMGFSKGQWRVVIPQSVLEAYFGNSAKDAKHQTYYQVLCVAEAATPQEIKTAHRRLARSFHPDLNKEEGARGRFEQIQAAYELLSNPPLRKKYDCGLYFERQGQTSTKIVHRFPYVPPLRCGTLKVEGVIKLARLRVSKIIEWADVVDECGRTLVTMWPKGADNFQSIWLEPEAIK